MQPDVGPGSQCGNQYLLTPSPFSFAFLSALKEKFADVFILVDSGMTPAEFQQVRGFLTRLVNQINFSPSTYRLGLAQYGQDIKVEFLFNTSKTREDVINAIKRFRLRKLQPNEARNLGSALRYAYKNVFTAEAGSRNDQSFRQYLVVLTGKDSDDPVYKEARLLQSAGITMISFSAGATIKDLDILSTRSYSYPSVSSAVPNLKTILEKREEGMPVTDGEKFFAALLSAVLQYTGTTLGPRFHHVGTVLGPRLNHVGTTLGPRWEPGYELEGPPSRTCLILPLVYFQIAQRLTSPILSSSLMNLEASEAPTFTWCEPSCTRSSAVCMLPLTGSEWVS